MSAGNILVVDDDQNLIELIGLKLHSGGYEVTWVQAASTRCKRRSKTYSISVCWIYDLQTRMVSR